MHLNRIYRWEDSPGLEHACWKCGTKQNHPKAIRTCYGIHTEPCFAYHQTLFAVRRSHSCKACITNEAAHFERHRIIAKLVNDVRGCEAAAQNRLVQRSRKPRKSDSNADHFTCDEGTETDISSCDLSLLDEIPEVNFEADARFTSPRERRGNRRTIKDKQNQDKALKNQQKIVLDVSQEHVDRVARAIHGAQYNVDKVGGHPGTNEEDSDGIFNRTDTFNASIKGHMSWLKEQVRGSRARKGKKGSEAWKRQHSRDAENGLHVPKRDVEELVLAVLSELGVLYLETACSTSNYTSSGMSNPGRRQKGSTPIQQLRKEIAADIEKSENESRARLQRMEGYWRYVNGTVTDRLASNDLSVDRQTGMMLKSGDERERSSKILKMGQTKGSDMEGDGDHEEGPDERDRR